MSTQTNPHLVTVPFAPHTQPRQAQPESEAHSSRQTSGATPPRDDIAKLTRPLPTAGKLTRPLSITGAMSRGKVATRGLQSTGPQAPAIQSLAAELHQAAIQGLFEYRRGLTLPFRVLASIFAMFSLFHLSLVAILTYKDTGSWASTLINWRTAGALVGALVALGVAWLLASLFRPVQVTPQGLSVQGLTGWRRVPWKQVGVLRVMAAPREHYVVFVPVKGTIRPPLPAPTLRVLPVLLGASTFKERGVVVTSDIKNFERLLQLIVSYMAQEAGQKVPAIESFIEEHVVMPVAQLVFDSEGALTRMARASETSVDPYAVVTVDPDLDMPLRNVFWRQALIAAGPALLLLVDSLLRHTEKPSTWEPFAWAVALLVIGMLELPFVAKLVQALGDLVVGSGKLKKALWAYLELQLPRAALVVLTAALMGIAVPPLLAVVCWLAGIMFTTVLSMRFVAKLYFINTSQASFAAIGVFLYQVALFAFYLGVR